MLDLFSKCAFSKLALQKINTELFLSLNSVSRNERMPHDTYCLIHTAMVPPGDKACKY
jgi:hypothetical protein